MTLGPGTTWKDTPKPRIRFDIDKQNCVITYKVLVQLLFKGKWTEARKIAFRNKLKIAIESTFNSTNFKIKPKNKKDKDGNCCPCPNGFSPKVKISFVPDGQWSTDEDWEADVHANPTKKPMQSSNLGKWADLDEDDLRPQPKPSSAPGVTQLPAVHEFGHFIGLDHPGVGVAGDEYKHKGKDRNGNDVDGGHDLMGGGNQVRPFYFDKWKNKLNSKNSGCSYETK
ncbi:hypothetical protein AAEX28_15475 [Lentisphaerota bacterium WC36G]